MKRIFRTLKYPEKNIIETCTRTRWTKNPFSDVVKAIYNPQFQECDEIQTFPRTPKLALPPETYQIFAVFLVVLFYMVHGLSRDILVTLDHGDMFFCCAQLTDRSAVTTFQSYHTNWISYFDAPCFTVVDRGSSLACTEMPTNIHSLQLQLFSVSIESPWSLGANEQSHQFLQKAIDFLLLQNECMLVYNFTVLLSDFSLSWNSRLHLNYIFPQL